MSFLSKSPVALMICTGLSLLAGNAFGAPLAEGKQKYLGGIHSGGSSNQEAGIPLYWNQVTPENACKWGSVEAVRGTYNWTAADAAYNLAKSNGLPFRFHVLLWGAQQPAWIRDLPDNEQLDAIKAWFAAVHAHFPDIDYLEVVNEAFHDKPDATWKWLTFVDNTTDPNCGNYAKALGGNGATGWDWVLEAFRLARQYFPNTKLMLNDYGIISDGNTSPSGSVAQYVNLINLLKAENLVDVVAEQAHAFNTSSASATTLTNNLNTIGATGLPIWITEMDIDGGTNAVPNDAVQLAEYQRVFPVLWNNPYVIGITTWGYRPGLWRTDQAAYLVLANGTERSAMTWLKQYVADTTPNLRALITGQPAAQSVVAGTATSFTVTAKGTPTPTYQWQKNGGDIPGATSATLSFASPLPGDAGTYRVVVTNTYGSATSANATFQVNGVAPSITTPPASQSVVVGSAASFTVVAGGTAPFTYQWQKGGVDISGATNATLSLPSTQFADAGTYRVVVTNVVSSTPSADATLTVTAMPPSITTQPASKTVVAGTNVSFSVVASGTAPFTYQWKKDSVDISGATDSSYAIANVQSGTTGSYTVVVTNSGGSATSNAAVLSLGVIPDGFDMSAYFIRYPAVAATYSTDLYAAWLYYRNQGIYDGQVFDDLFRVEEYLTLYPELFAIFGSDLGAALDHWLSTGRIEGKLGRIPGEFSADGYFTRNPDVATAVGNDPLLAWGHYWLYGIYEGRAYDDELRVFEYLAINADLTAAFVNDWRQAALHWMRYGRTEGRLGRLPLTFSVSEYLNRSPDVAAVWGTNPTTVFLHFWLYGIDENRTYDDLFRPDEYMTRYPDVAAAVGGQRRGAFKHWVRYGLPGGRIGRYP